MIFALAQHLLEAAILAGRARHLPFWQSHWLAVIIVNRLVQPVHLCTPLSWGYAVQKHPCPSTGRYPPIGAVPNPRGQPPRIGETIPVNVQKVRIIRNTLHEASIRFKSHDHFGNAHDFPFQLEFSQTSTETHLSRYRDLYPSGS